MLIACLHQFKSVTEGEFYIWTCKKCDHRLKIRKSLLDPPEKHE